MIMTDFNLAFYQCKPNILILLSLVTGAQCKLYGEYNGIDSKEERHYSHIAA